MKYSRTLNFFTIILALFFLVGCSDNKESKLIDYGLIASEKTLPESVGDFNYIIRKSNNKSEFEETWNFYRFDKDLPNIDLALKDIIFIGLEESSNCPYEINNKNIELGLNNKVIKLTFPKQYGACFTDATPRTIVIEIDKVASKSIKHVVIVNENGEETSVPYK
ncbi:hypothetical protein ACIQXI_06735 [Lysinibacillus sp. NPDC097195]|uniref:hypothetical protein n=1 Tax=Lysinibacillus sp. NPDC097195 TaxID=3364141 RepID=UPI0038071056